MVLTIIILWLALGALAVFFIYCCSCVSNGPDRAFTDDAEAGTPLAVRLRIMSQTREARSHATGFARPASRLHRS